MSNDQRTRLTDYVPDDPGIEDTHVEHLPNGDFWSPVERVPIADAQGDVSGELPSEATDLGAMGAISRMDID